MATALTRNRLKPRSSLIKRWKACEPNMGYQEYLEQELLEYDYLFELQQSRTGAATKLWRQAHPEKRLVIPDLGKLVEWLMERADKAEAEANLLRERIKTIRAPRGRG